MTRLKYWEPLIDNWELLPLPAYVNEVWIGPVAPTDPNVELWYDTTIGVMKVWVENTWRTTAGDYLPTGGGTITGNLTVNGATNTVGVLTASAGVNASNQKVTNLADATATTDAVNKKLLDAKVLYGTAAPSGTGYAPGTIYCQYT